MLEFELPSWVRVRVPQWSKSLGCLAELEFELPS